MKILVVTQYFWPEEFRINDICKEFKNNGHEVDVLTGLPNYPKGKYFNGYSLFKYGPKKYEGINIYRCAMLPRGENNVVGMILNYISFVVAGTIRLIPLLFKKYDRVFVFQISPITTAIPAILISKLKGIKSFIYVQDLWPETFYSIKNIQNKTIRKTFKYICIKIYNSFNVLLIASRGYNEILSSYGIKKEKIEYFPQWGEDIFETMVNGENIGIKNEKFKIMFAGNIGKAQGVDTIIYAANKVRENTDIEWIILGDGSEFENIKKLITELKLQDTVKLLGRKPVDEMPNYFSQASAMLVTLKDEFIFNNTVPAKVQAYMAAGKPIIACANGETAHLITQCNCGVSCKASNSEDLARAVNKLFNLDIEERVKMGENGLLFYRENFTKNKLVNRLFEIMKI